MYIVKYKDNPDYYVMRVPSEKSFYISLGLSLIVVKYWI